VSIEQTNRINASPKRCYRYGYVDKIHCTSDLLNSVDLALFDKMHSKAHCLYPLLPPVRNQLEHLRSRGHDFTSLLYPHVNLPKIFTGDLSSCVICLTLCNNHIGLLLYWLIVVLYYTIIFLMQVPLCFAYFYFMYYHICVCHVSVNISYLLAYLCLRLYLRIFLPFSPFPLPSPPPLSTFNKIPKFFTAQTCFYSCTNCVRTVHFVFNCTLKSPNF